MRTNIAPNDSLEMEVEKGSRDTHKKGKRVIFETKGDNRETMGIQKAIRVLPFCRMCYHSVWNEKS